MKCLTLSASFLVIWIAVSCAQAQVVGDPLQGRELAQQFCSECHAVLRGEAHSPNTQAPTFADLAATPGMTGTALLVALTTPHAGMPMFALTAEQRENLIAYVLSFR